MELTDVQRETVKQWIAKGAGLSEVQRRLQSELGVSMTYMDVRLLVLELKVPIKEKPAAKSLDAAVASEEVGEFEDEDAPLPAAPGGKSSVRVTLDRVVQAGAVVSGEAVFSDGKKARWLLDQYGRLGLDPVQKGYRPSAADVQSFQTQLRELLAQRGY